MPFYSDQHAHLIILKVSVIIFFQIHQLLVMLSKNFIQSIKVNYSHSKIHHISALPNDCQYKPDML